ncbi:MAG: hypothetical protein N2109_00530 [Fimbriimonadales bacterium]|nr:hypothetical protein [Fimbriimonadales bacterium]
MAARRPIRIYSTWGFHDELGDRVRLSEELCHRALDRLQRWRSEHGMAFDCFHIDCFWFDKSKPYTAFDPETFPDGPEPILRRVREMGMRFGLWFAVNGGHMNPPEWQASKATNGWCYSLLDGPYAESFEAALHHAAEQWGCRVFKFDFADWTASADPARPPSETRQRSVDALRGILDRLRCAYPDAVLFAHCGFALSEQSTVSGLPDPLAADPSWLGVLDRLFSGDPHPIDIPQTSLVRNLDLYQDRQVWALHRCGFPLDRIDDHGALLGTTNTCCYRGRKGFPRTCLGQLARGGKRHLLYGNPEVLTDEDVRFMKAATELFLSAWSKGLEASFVGTGEPGLAPWHGYLTGGGAAGLLYLVNPTQEQQVAELRVPGLHRALPLWSDGPEPPVLVQQDLVTLQLEGEQCALLGLGAFADPAFLLPEAPSEPLPGRLRLLSADIREAARKCWEVRWRPSTDARGLWVFVQAHDEKPSHARLGFPSRFGQQLCTAEANGIPPSEAQREYAISLTCGPEQREPSSSVPDVPIWAGISWVARRFERTPSEAVVRIRDESSSERRLKVRAYEEC